MDYCGPQGIPYGQFLAWDDLSRDAAIAWQQRRNATCGGCGQVTAEWMTAGPDGQPVEIVPPPMIVDTSYCPACSALEMARSAKKDGGNPAQRLAFVPTPVKD